jgi:hypothetical protein
MKNGKTEDKAKQRTKKGLEIPVPKRADFDRLIRNAANTPVPDVPETKKPLRRSPRGPKK